MATPWWLLPSTRLVWYGDDTAGGMGAPQGEFVDATTGKTVYEQDGKYYYTKPTPDKWEWFGDETAGGVGLVPGNPGVEVPASLLNSTARTAKFITDEKKGILAPYGNLGGEVGTVDGKPTYLYPMSRGATLAGDLGMYGGAQRAYWRSPSGAQGTAVVGPDGAMWVMPPADAQYGENDTADHSTMLGQAWGALGPIITSALSAGLGSGLTSSLADTLGGGITGQLGSKAIMGGASSLLTGGDGITGALTSGLGGALGGALPALDLGLPSYATSALTGGIGSAIAGGDPLTGALMGAGGNLAGSALGDLGFSAPATSALIGGAKSLIGGGDPLIGAIMGGGQSLLGQIGKSAPDTSLSSNQSETNDLLNAFSSTPSPQSTVDTLASATTGVNPATAWSSDTFDNWDASLGQLPQSPSPADTQVTTGQPLPEPFQQAGSSSLPWDQPAGSLNTYTEQQPVTTPAEPVTTSPASGGGNMAFFDDLLGGYTGDMGEFSPGAFQTPGNASTDPSSLWPTTGVADPIYNLDGTAGSNYLNYGVTSGLDATDPNQTYWPITPDQAVPSSSSLDSLLRSLGLSGTGLGSAINSAGNLLSSGSGNNLISRGLAAAPALAAINYARNQTPYDTSQLSSVFNQMNPSAQVGMYDMASGQQKTALQSDLARRQVAGSSFGDQSLASFDTIRDLGRNALLNQGLAGQADVAAKMVDAQAKQRAAQNQLYGSALYALGGALSPRNAMGF